MRIIIHNGQNIVEVLNKDLQVVKNLKPGAHIIKTLVKIAESNPDELLLWSHEALKEYINLAALEDIFHHKKILASYNPSSVSFLPEQIGYVEQTYFLKINKSVTYPTWLASSSIGGVHATVINNIKGQLISIDNFDYFLSSLAKYAMPKGLFCYSEPKLLIPNATLSFVQRQASTYQLFKFVRQHYKLRWVFFLSLCYLIFEKKVTFFSLIKVLGIKKITTICDIEDIELKSSRGLLSKKEIDVIIPTLGRAKYLYNVLKDLSKQSVQPKRVIIIEQNPDPTSKTELDYLEKEQWPFTIVHHFIHKTGACNARNMALKEVQSDWFFLADDDISFDENLLNSFFNSIKKHGIKSIVSSCLKPNEIQTYTTTSQSPIFGSGCSIVKSELLDRIKFNMNYEHGFGEDSDFGMQIRNCGEDVLYDASIRITHLKAPSGGFRTAIKQPWDDDNIKPKPSPTIMYLRQTYATKTQLLGYKLLLFFKYYKNQKTLNPFKYFKQMKLKWERSVHWSHKLAHNEAVQNHI